MDMHDTSKLNFYIAESYRDFKNAEDDSHEIEKAYSFNNGYLEACFDFQIIEYPKFKELKEYNERLFKEV